MRNILFTILALCLVSLPLWADEQKKVSLSNDHRQATVSLGYCNIFATLGESDGDERGLVTIELENLDESNVLILFDQAYSEKSIKKMPTSIRFDKKFGGTKNKRVIDPSNVKLRSVLQFRPSERLALPVFAVDNGETARCRLPIYIAKYKGKKKLLLLEKQVIELDVEADLKPSKEYLDVSDAYEKLAKELETKTLCNNSRHKPSLSKQKEAYEQRIEELKGRIDGIIAIHGWTEGSAGYKRFSELKVKLNLLNFREGDCGKHGRSGHSCSYCSLSLQQIYHKLDDCYKKIYSSSDRQAAKASVIGQVNALYQCCTDASCSKHAAAWKKGGDYKTKITERYNRIKNL